MIGIMNAGCDDSSVEFYASARQSSLYARKPSKDSRTYTNEGRVLINGVPEVQDTPDELWRSLISRAVTDEAMKNVTHKGKGSCPLAIIRRFSSNLGFGKSPNIAKKASSVNDENEIETKGDGRYVTIVRIKTIHKKQQEDYKKKPGNDDEQDDEVRIYAEEGVLKCLMEEKAMFESEIGEISMEWATDRNPEIIDEETDIVVERF
ncbi:hypothetical protein DICVIV_01796 [Dictyocaulus viviparus]|uniref:Uncharacterized protein n=1 Tax=Dictyocaulus viviparus TaxID=29172 RepID=A0A0D8Y5H4_DICVI|nr:hypothetical protein DICVIV_01796 [Dictyocaulus viviparus]